MLDKRLTKNKKMFRKIISNLPFSPALIGQLGFYAKRLRKEEITRRLGLIFVVLTLVIQSFAVFIPAESANASNQSDMVNGGLGDSLNNFLKPYDANTKHLKDVMNYTGITREEISATKLTTFKVSKKISWGFVSRFSYNEGERQHEINDKNGQQVTTIYSRPLALWNGADVSVKGWVGHSESIGWFAIMQACGNLVTDTIPKAEVKPEPKPGPEPKCVYNSNLLTSDKNCKPCPGNESLWIDSPSCIPNIVKTKTATNISKGFIDASTIIASASDQISYTITIENTGLDISSSIKLEDNLSDILEYSTLTDNGGGTLDKTTGILSWPNITLKSKTKQTRTFVLKLPETIPSTAQGLSDGTSYDCIMTNTFGNSININVDCPAPKIIEQVVKELPKTGATENMIFTGIIFAVITYFYARSKQTNQEIKLIRRDASSGII